MIYSLILISNIIIAYLSYYVGKNAWRVERQKLEERREWNMKIMGDAILAGNMKTICPDCYQDTTKKMKFSLRKIKENQ